MSDRGHASRKWALWRPLTAAAIGLALVTGACAPSRPLYQPSQGTATYGYTDVKLGPTRFTVNYKAPDALTYSFTKARREEDARARLDIAYDMALWRASDLALANGYPAFTVVGRSNDANVELFFGDPTDLPGQQCLDPCLTRACNCVSATRPYGDLNDTYGRITAQVTITVELGSSPGPGLLDAAQTIATLRVRYPDAAPPGRTAN
jgi:hypothetical protein